MALLSRVAGRIYWAARYIERAEDTSRLVRAFGELVDDLPEPPPDRDAADTTWPPLASVAGGDLGSEWPTDEHGVVRFLVTDRARPGSVVTSVERARENLRTTREVLPREAWQVLNDLWLFVDREADRAVERRLRDRFLGRVVDESRRLDGVLTSTMTRDAAYEMWRLGRYLERADMTTRVVGVRAAALMAASHVDGRGHRRDHDEVHWMGVLRSLSALQMYQRATRGPIEASSVVRFLLYRASFPRSVEGALDEIERSLANLSRSDDVLAAVGDARLVLRSTSPMVDDGEDLDGAMDRVQLALADVDRALTERFLRIDGAG